MNKKIEPYKITIELTDGTKKVIYFHGIGSTLSMITHYFRQLMGNKETVKQVKAFSNLEISLYGDDDLTYDDKEGKLKTKIGLRGYNLKG